jgi:hypothetical protein
MEHGRRVAEPNRTAHATSSELQSGERVDRQEIGLDEIVDVAERDLGGGCGECVAKPGTEARQVGRAEGTTDREDGR